jgi:hypothetical protein
MGQSSVIESQTFNRPAITQAIQSGSDALHISRRPLLCLNIVCLDAPLVALAWQWLLAQTFSVAVPLANRVALFLTAWFIYLIDRFADSVSLSANFPKSIRQQVCSDHRNLWLALILMVGILDAGIIFTRLDFATTMGGLVLGLVALCYLILNWAYHRVWETVPIKELIIGVLFAAGTVVVGLPLASIAKSTIAFTSAAGLFAMLCWLNCVSIAVWERNLDLLQAKHSIATRSPDVKYCACVWLVGIASISVVLFFFGAFDPALAICLSISAVLLFLLHFGRIPRDERTALADLVLLTPFAFLFLEKLL